MTTRTMTGSSITLATLLALAGCGSSHSSQSDGGVCGTPISGGGVLQDLQPPCDPGPGGILVSASGEALSLGGYSFPPVADQEVAFVDGWELRFSRVVVTFDHVTFSESPDTSPTDQSQTGALVARVDGPWAVDLHQGGPLPGKGGGDEQAVAVAALTGKNQAGGGAFDPTRRYAFGFEAVAATAQAKNVNLDADGLTDYQDMIAKGYTALFAGTATWKGDASCTSTIAGYDFSQLPTVIDFRFGFKLPATYVNCQNPDNDPAEPFPDEEHLRGVAVRENQSTIAQVTFHTDHLFWDSFIHDSPPHFDQYAARYAGAAGVPQATMEDYVGYALTPFVDALGNPLPWRSCLAEFTPPVASGPMSFDTGGIPVNPAGSPTTSFRDYYDAVSYSTSTLGHLNADGLCFVVRDYPSPP